jgi:hypothetical protein
LDVASVDAWATPKAFPRDRPDAFACNIIATSNVRPVPTTTPSGSWVFGRVTGGSGEAPQPPAVDENRFAIGVASVDAWATPKACSSKAGGVGVSPTPPDEATNAHNAEGVSEGSARHVRVQHHRDIERQSRSHGDPFGVVGAWSRDRG